MKIIDLRSDTVTQQTQAMRDAMLVAEVGDDVYRDDPTVNELEKLAAKILGKEAALFVTSGTMGNQLALMAQTRRGDEVIVSANCHIFEHEVGGAAVLSGANLRMLYFEDGMPDAQSIEAAIRPDDIHEPQTALICLENALANGRVVPAALMAEIYQMAQKHKIPLHIDGARLFNAAAAQGVDVKELTKSCDTVMCCLSKGLCAPVGSMLAGPRDVIERARKYRKMLGGGMRQAGFLAAAGIIAIRDMPARLHIDHENAAHLADRLAGLDGVTLDRRPEINMVFFHIDRPQKELDAIPAKMLKKGFKISPAENGRFRWLTNNDVTRQDVDSAVDALASILK